MLRLKNVSRGFASKGSFHPVLTDISLAIQQGELCALTGSSGSGKTTLMNLIGLLDLPDSGTIEVAGLTVSSLTPDDAATMRNRLLGFVFQSFHLLPTLNAIDNVALPLIYRGINLYNRRALAVAALDRVGLAEHKDRSPDEMSGGQRQRVAIARALVGKPSLLLADEPTGNLDSSAAAAIMALFLELNLSEGLTVLIVTHDPTMAARCPRRIVMRDGQVYDDNRGELRDIKPSI